MIQGVKRLRGEGAKSTGTSPLFSSVKAFEKPSYAISQKE